MYIILVYDIRQVDDFQRVQRRTFKECKKYLYHVQNSVFEGEISQSQMYELKSKLEMIFRSDLDSCIIFKSSNKRWLTKEYVTVQIDENPQFI